MTDKKDHGDMDRFVWASDHIRVIPTQKKDQKKKEADQLPSGDQSKTPKGG